MNQPYIEELIARSIDENLSQKEQTLLDQALADSQELRDLHDDLQRLNTLASLGVETPNPRMGATLMARVAATYPQKPQAPVIPFTRFLSPTPAKLALAALLLLALSALLQPWGQELQSSQTQIAHAYGMVLSRQLDAAARFHQSTRDLEYRATTRMATLPLETTRNYHQHLDQVNRAIRLCEQSMIKAPINISLQSALQDAYQAKTDLLQVIVSG